MSQPTPPGTPASQIDPRGPRFTAGVTLVVFAVVLLTAPATAGVILLAVQTAFFVLGAGLGVQRTPTAYVFRTLVRPRLGAPSHLEDTAPPRFAQAVGLVFSAVALTAYVADATLLGQIFSGFALAAATLNAVFGFCLGCELYVIGHRVLAKGSKNSTTTTEKNKEEVAA